MEDNKDNSVKETESHRPLRSDDGHSSGGDERPAMGKGLD